MSNFEFTIKDYSKQYLKEMEEHVKAAMTECGIRAERYAKVSLTESDAVDTGLLRNSVTYAISGEAPNVSSYKADNPSKYGGKGKGAGSYNGVMDKESSGVAMYVGTNVEYAPYIEMGTGTGNASSGGPTWRKTEFNGGHGNAARPFIKPAIADHIEEYKEIIIKHLG